MMNAKSGIQALRCPVRWRRNGRVALALLCASAPWSLAMAQYDPGATLDLGMGYGQNALSQSAMRSAAKDLPEPHPGKDDDYASSGKSRDEHLAALRREYARRVAADGVASANAWATEMGRRDARAERD